MRSTFTVSVGGDRGLTDLSTLKDDLGISGTSEDSYLERQIDRASALVCDYLGVAPAADGSVTLGLETLVQTFRDVRGEETLLLARIPVGTISGIVLDDEALTDSDWEVDAATGILRRVSEEVSIGWIASETIVVTYTGGWVLPGNSHRDLPYPIEEATIALIKGSRAARLRDPMVKERDVPGVLRQSFWVGGIAGAVIPPDIAARLDPYRNDIQVG